jgi:tetratricopeptide (TPR) repeat protein
MGSHLAHVGRMAKQTKVLIDKPNELLTLSGLNWLRQRFGLPIALAILVLAGMTIIWWNWKDIEQRPGVGPIVDIFRRRSIPIVEPGHVTIAVAHFEYDKDFENENLLLDELRQFGGAELTRIDRTIGWPEANTERVAETIAKEVAKRLLHVTGADVLIWGRVMSLKDRSILRIYWTTAEDLQGTKRTERYPIENLMLPTRFSEDLKQIIDVLVQSRTSPVGADVVRNTAREQTQKSFAPSASEDNEQAIELYQDALTHLRPDATARERAEIESNLAKAYHARIGGSKADNIETAIKLYEDALALSSSKASAPERSAIQINLANAYQARIQGDRADNLKRALELYLNVLTVTKREASPQEWATTQNNLGIALQGLGELESGTARLEEAVVAYRSALTELTREQAARTQSNLGKALSTLGERESGTAPLEEAVAVYRSALTVLTREQAPLDWATTQLNLGKALETLGERESGTARLEEAVAVYRSALTELTRERVPLDWATTQLNLGNALETLGERESGTARLEEAVAAYRSALTVLTREQAPLDWATTQNRLGETLSLLGARENRTALLQEAVAAWEACLTVAATDWPQGWVQYVRSRVSATRVQIAQQTKR